MNKCIDCHIELKRKGKGTFRCWDCHLNRQKTERPRLNKEIRTCETCGGPKGRTQGTKICIKCYRDSKKDKIKYCKTCKNRISKPKYDYCQKCYKGPNTKRWNKELTEEFRLKGRTVNPEYYKWRLLVFERDGFQCRKCGDNKGGNLVAHHIFSFSENPDLRTDVNNGVTFCDECHIQFHRKYGYRNNNNIQLKEFIN